MRKLLVIIVSIAIGSTVFAQGMSVQNTAATAKCNTAGQSCPLSTDASGRLLLGPAGTGATALGKAEDAAHVSGDTGVMMLGVIDSTASSGFGGVNGDYSPPAMTLTGALYANIDSNSQASTARGILKSEDAAHTTGDAGVASLFVTEDPLTVSQNATTDYANPKVDRNGRVITTLAPAGETFQSCGTATAVTSDVAIKAAVASNRMYVTSITCKNTSITASTPIDFKDGSTIIAVGGVGAVVAASGTSGAYFAEFPTPLRGSSNTALNFATNTATTSVTCCAQGFVSVN
jgi:hypothetical protein